MIKHGLYYILTRCELYLYKSGFGTLPMPGQTVSFFFFTKYERMDLKYINSSVNMEQKKNKHNTTDLKTMSDEFQSINCRNKCANSLVAITKGIPVH